MAAALRGSFGWGRALADLRTMLWKPSQQSPAFLNVRTAAGDEVCVLTYRFDDNRSIGRSLGPHVLDAGFLHMRHPSAVSGSARISQVPAPVGNGRQ